MVDNDSIYCPTSTKLSFVAPTDPSTVLSALLSIVLSDGQGLDSTDNIISDKSSDCSSSYVSSFDLSAVSSTNTVVSINYAFK